MYSNLQTISEIPEKFEIISDDDLVKFPYCSIGKLIARDSITSTAFHIGDKTIITAAHFFDDANVDTAKFIPAMKDEKDVHGDRYGSYKVKNVRIHPDYAPDQEHSIYDICSANIFEGK